MSKLILSDSVADRAVHLHQFRLGVSNSTIPGADNRVNAAEQSLLAVLTEQDRL